MDVMEKTQQVTTAQKQGPETRNINIDNTVLYLQTKSQ